MTERRREGVIKFHLDFQQGPPPHSKDLLDLNLWRRRFLEQGLIGQDPQRYEGLGFGNLSHRLAGRGDTFVITGTQTGHLEELTPGDYAIVLSCEPDKNRLAATGPVKPSSEALSHGILYLHNQDIDWVMHLHSPDIFNVYPQLDLPFTNPAADYGTPEMASEIKRLAEEHDCSEPGLIVMAGHQDGILAFGSHADRTGELVLEILQRARQIS